MKVAITSGGTGGHIYPAISLIKYLKNNGEEAIFIGKNRGMEEDIAKENNIDFIGLNIEKGKKIKGKFTMFLQIIKNTHRLSKMFKQNKPDIVIGFGNYISVPVIIAAKLNKIPIILHEQNTILGKANYLLGFFANKIICSLPLIKEKHKKKILYYGNSRSNECLKSHNTQENIDMSKNNILIFMGSLGSTSINEVLINFINYNDDNNIYHIITGKKHYSSFISKVRAKSNINIYPYITNIIPLMKKCDVVVTRSGATTICEITSLGLASILIPSPYVSNNHQYYNAKYLSENDACILLEENSLSHTILKENIDNLLANRNLRISLRLNSLKLAIFDTNKKIYELMKGIINE